MRSTWTCAAPAPRLRSPGGTRKPSVTSSKQASGQRSAKKTNANPSGSRCERHVMPHAQGAHPRIAEAQRRVIAYSAAAEAVSQVSWPIAARSPPERRLTIARSSVVRNQPMLRCESPARGSRRAPLSSNGRSRRSASETAVASSPAAYRNAYLSFGRVEATTLEVVLSYGRIELRDPESRAVDARQHCSCWKQKLLRCARVLCGRFLPRRQACLPDQLGNRCGDSDEVIRPVGPHEFDGPLPETRVPGDPPGCDSPGIISGIESLVNGPHLRK